MSAERRLIGARAFVGVLLCVVYPLLSYLVPGIGPAWAMYTGTILYRLRIVVVDAGGARYTIPASAISTHATPRAETMLLGAEDWRHGFPATLPSQLDRFARVLCDDTRVVRAEVEFDVRDASGGAVRTTRGTTRCPRPRR